MIYHSQVINRTGGSGSVLSVPTGTLFDLTSKRNIEDPLSFSFFNLPCLLPLLIGTGQSGQCRLCNVPLEYGNSLL